MKQGHLLCMKPGSRHPSHLWPPAVGRDLPPGSHKDLTEALKNGMESTWTENLIGLNPSLTISNYFGIDISFYKINVSLPEVEFLAFVAKSKPFHFKGSDRDEPDAVLTVLIEDEFCRLENMEYHIYSVSFVSTFLSISLTCTHSLYYSYFYISKLDGGCGYGKIVQATGPGSEDSLETVISFPEGQLF